MINDKKKQKITRVKRAAATGLALFLAGVFSLGVPYIRAEEELQEEEFAAELVGEGRTEDASAPELTGLVFEKQMDFTYAECADVYYYEGGYKYFRVYDSADYLLVPENGEIPENLSADVVILHKPQNIYMAATGAMALFNAMDGLDHIAFSSVTAENWYVQAAQDAMNNGEIIYAGKYSAPDFELLISRDCDLAVESTMILHTPKVQEMLQNLGIPVFIDRSSYEPHPLGRTEWVKVYGAMLDQEEAADSFFQSQSQVLEELKDIENSGKTVAFFYVNTNGTIVVRRPGDTVPIMIELAGGNYALNDVSSLEGTMRSSVSMTMEEFYANAVDADYLIYNSTIASPIYTLQDLLDKSPLFADFKAVQEGNVWCADKYLYQATDIVGELIRDFYHMLNDGDEDQMTFLYKIN
ncbi:MAG: ABC transporter substrate-binding protein [Parasporobacterium sp.]|nr:ABC transporter substrate-binding protein [Parasporobacterium sp.]